MEWIYLLVLLPLLDYVPSCCYARRFVLIAPKGDAATTGRANVARVVQQRERMETRFAYHLIPLVLALVFLQLCAVYSMRLPMYLLGGLIALMVVLVAQCIRLAIALRVLQDEQDQWEAWIERQLSPYYTS
ncbi:hypothetical protein SPRG_10146 [Saprolegnia parasitica CBS 223.65]|uniref:Uncharacterized protein n=1 Tax=Saprolegnia parasitica (strain CBS 223.65) TaxID=695850 RepID=A0A067C1G6_SAPPC|nr:hypothetical protein SPRG_10146 [Saprolegnia parasitica CBS 223.65]KDO24614.1 hypothetical protein SPRG_10146 [Saprolegnia parasitica CBS 223.65]|eukprot:XP_012204682.1 hypothetical protein SPRG_10146 [Saprolegnia parasitica CBS 223.65]